jgi:hypothetical protein
VDDRSPIPIQRQLTEQLKHFIEGGGFSRERALPSIRELAGFLGINPNTVARVFEAHLPVRVDRVLLHGLAARLRCRKPAERWRAAVTSFFHLAEVERRLSGTQVPVVALLAEAHLETLHRLAQLPAGTRVGVASDDFETTHTLKHSIANAGLPNLTLVGACHTEEEEALRRLVRRADVIVCSTLAAERVRLHAGPTQQLIIDDRAIDKQAIDILATFLVRTKHQGTSGVM